MSFKVIPFLRSKCFVRNTLLSQMWWLIGSVQDFRGRGPGFESNFYVKDSAALEDYCVIQQKILGLKGEPPPEAKKIISVILY